ncbi:MAG: polysaccharide deacetylase family protein [Clostridia bacterium]|nr:polysaccharide deacetylase family protein [Clostridia bacterium]
MKGFLKKITVLFLILSLLSVPLSAKAAECKSWYIKRNGNKTPIFPEDAEELKEYNCYFIDEECADLMEHRLYLTFDAGYSNESFEKILDILNDENVPAAFFLLDNIILKNTDLVNRLEDEGHLVCNHTKNHKNLSFSSKQAIAEDLSALENIYREQTGREMTKYFRFPEGKYSLEAIKSVNELGYTTVFWSFGYDDWDNSRQMSPEKAKKKILENTHDGAVILLHPTSTTNASILRDLIHTWRDMGYEFYSLDDFGK